MESIQRMTPTQQFLGDLFRANYSARQIKEATGLDNQDLDLIRRGSDAYRLFARVFIAWCEAYPEIRKIHDSILFNALMKERRYA